MMKIPIVLFGAGSHAYVVIDIIERMKVYEIVGLIDSRRDIGTRFDSYKIIGRQENLKDLIYTYSIKGGIVCIGDNYWRGHVSDKIIKQIPGFNFINAVHPSVIVGKNVKMGNGNVFMPGVIINPGAVIGNHCIINTNSSLEHYCTMKDFSSLSAGVTTGGYTEIGNYSAVALGVTLFDRVKIGNHVVIGSGALVTKDIKDYSLAYGVPAKVVRKREAGDKYLK